MKERIKRGKTQQNKNAVINVNSSEKQKPKQKLIDLMHWKPSACLKKRGRMAVSIVPTV